MISQIQFSQGSHFLISIHLTKALTQCTNTFDHQYQYYNLANNSSVTL